MSEWDSNKTELNGSRVVCKLSLMRLGEDWVWIATGFGMGSQWFWCRIGIGKDAGTELEQVPD